MVPYPKSVLESTVSGSTGRKTRESKNEEQQSGETLSRRAFVGSLAAMSAVAPALAPASALDQQAAAGSLGVATMSDAILSEIYGLPLRCERVFAGGYRIGLRMIYPASGCLRRGGP